MASKLIRYMAAPVHFVTGRIATPELTDPEQVKPGLGAVIQYGGEKVAVYRDESGKLYAMSPVCRHLKCIVGWNAGEKTWDCPCHGSRYNFDGAVIHGPAKSDLVKFAL